MPVRSREKVGLNGVGIYRQLRTTDYRALKTTDFSGGCENLRASRFPLMSRHDDEYKILIYFNRTSMMGLLL